MHFAFTSLDSPLGRYTIAASDFGVTHLQTEGSAKLPSRTQPASAEAESHAKQGAIALADYFSGKKNAFDALTLASEGTVFQQQVWAALREIPYGQTESYGQLASRISQPGAARAVGSANHENPIGIAVPCHRVIGADGSLTGYAGGLDRKRWLLSHEGALDPTLPF